MISHLLQLCYYFGQIMGNDLIIYNCRKIRLGWDLYETGAIGLGIFFNHALVIIFLIVYIPYYIPYILLYNAQIQILKEGKAHLE